MLVFRAFLLIARVAARADVAQGDSADFIFNTTDQSPAIGGAAQADSPDFILNTTDQSSAIGGVVQGDSAEFTLNTTGLFPGAQADSADFTLDTRTILVVTTLADSGAGCLRQVIANAPPNTTVTFASINGSERVPISILPRGSG